MIKPVLGVIALSILTVFGPTSPQQGCQGAVKSLTNLAYPPVRDMRTSVIPADQRYRLPDSASVPVQGRELARTRDELDRTFVLPRAADDSSLARGERKFQKLCVPCHGPSLKGDGLVAAKFMPPPDLLNASSRGRSDGYIYSYIRHGGAIMPSYGAQVTAEEAYDLIHYLRHMQRTNPR